MRRFFNRGEKAVLYLAADGRCESCGDPLDVGWHADHLHPFIRNGATTIANGQALCAGCNLAKGSNISMSHDYTDVFKPREFQQRLIDAVLDNNRSGKRTTVAIASPGSGKTLAYQAAATHLIREGAIDLVAVYAPRKALTSQCELEYHDPETGTGHFELFDDRLRLEYMQETGNRPPLTPPKAERMGFVSTYSSLVSQPRIHRHWAEQHQGRFLLIGDEAQFLGSTDEDNGTKAAQYFREMSALAAHTLILTGTEARSDGQQIILADYEPRDDGLNYLIADVRSTYSDGIAQGYLRPFEAVQVDAEVTRTDYSGAEPVTSESKLSLNDEQLGQVLDNPGIWTELASMVVEQLRKAQEVHPGYKALIACKDQSQAKDVAKFLKQGGVRADLSISEDGNEASRILNDFKTNASDVLVSVRKAFLGYDCKAITVVGLLTNYRDRGHLEQLLGRGLRMWDQVPADQQFCRVVAPNDSRMVAFVNAMLEESDQGVRNRPVGPPTDRPGGGGEESPIVVEDVEAADVTSLGKSGYVDAQGMNAIEYYHAEFPSTRNMPNGELFRLVNHVAGRPNPVTPTPKSRGMTREQMKDDYLTRADKLVKKACGPYNDATKYAWTATKRELSNELNRQYSRIYRSAESTNRKDDWFPWVEDAENYFKLAQRLFAQERAR